MLEDRLKAFLGRGINLDLAPIREVLGRLGNPQDKYPSLIVGGTNGKGSVCALLSSILKQAGYKVGLYTSPHLVDVQERIKINDTLISEGEFNENLERVLEAGGERLTYFEILTAIAFHFFRQREVDIAILEVGMGGRWDATNVVTPMLSIITNVSLDHREFLGATLSAIAREKAGIIKEGGVCVTGVSQLSPLREIKRICSDREAKLYILGQDFRIRRWRKEGKFDYYGLFERYMGLSVALRGAHQVRNAALVIAAKELLSRRGWMIEEDKMLLGLQRVHWEGRMELVNAFPVTILDGAHNPAGIGALCRALEEEYPGRKYITVFGCLADKDHRLMLSRLQKLSSLIILTNPPTPRARPARELMEAIEEGRAIVVEDPSKAYKTALALASMDDVVCVTGSLYLVGAIKSFLNRDKKESWGERSF